MCRPHVLVLFPFLPTPLLTVLFLFSSLPLLKINQGCIAAGAVQILPSVLEVFGVEHQTGKNPFPAAPEFLVSE